MARWIKNYGAERFILGADVIDQKIAISAWQDKTKIDVFDFILSYLDSDLSSCICTDVSRDGLLTGPALKLYVDLKKKFPQIFLIASGGISNIMMLSNLTMLE